MDDTALHAISPIEGRYRQDVEALRRHFSEYALIRGRLLVEVEYFIALAARPAISFMRPLAPEEAEHLRDLYRHFSEDDAARVKAIEARTQHDVKAVEYFLRERIADTALAAMREGVHFGLTSEDVTNLAHALNLRDGLHEALFPEIDALRAELEAFAAEHAATPMLARTHGQPASPTTLGKEMAVFAARLGQQRAVFQSLHESIPGKLNGATGNFNAHAAAYPAVDWVAFSRAFVAGLGLEPNLCTTQIEPQDTTAAICHAIARINTILIDFSQDMWRYISDGYFTQRVVQGEVGSSTMPHKVNPIRFENAEGNLEVANALLALLARRLPVSRLQRDLSNSTVTRNLGVALAHCLLAYKNLRRGLGRITANEARLREDLRANWAVITEAIQTILRREGLPDAYELLKSFSREGVTGRAAIEAFVQSLDVPAPVKAEMLRLAPETYTGLAEKLARSATAAR
jgi:adenylosuccinate lyase